MYNSSASRSSAVVAESNPSENGANALHRKNTSHSANTFQVFMFDVFPVAQSLNASNMISRVLKYLGQSDTKPIKVVILDCMSRARACNTIIHCRRWIGTTKEHCISCSNVTASSTFLCRLGAQSECASRTIRRLSPAARQNSWHFCDQARSVHLSIRTKTFPETVFSKAGDQSHCERLYNGSRPLRK